MNRKYKSIDGINISMIRQELTSAVSWVGVMEKVMTGIKKPTTWRLRV